METKTRDRSSRSAGRADEDDDAIDPRIRARRILVKRDEDRSRLSRLIIVLGLLAVVAGSVAALRSPLLDVDHVRVAGARRTSPASDRGDERSPAWDLDGRRQARGREPAGRHASRGCCGRRSSGSGPGPCASR